jgi:glutathione synthase/RimK-type ligase-like ATP-grasp enzyme
MKVFIVAHEKDDHTAPLKWALERAGYPVFCWPGLGWSSERQASIHFAGEAEVSLGGCSLEAGDVVWIRRPQPASPHPEVAEPDKKFAQGEYRWFNDSLLYSLEFLPVRCVNHYSASRLIRNKAVQLVLARQCGLKVPSTLMSNTPAAVRSYLAETSGPKICKAFFPHIWQRDGGKSLAVTATFEINETMVGSDAVLTYAPAIYQTMVKKPFDVRMVLLGTSIYSYALYNPKGSTDWRQDACLGHVQVESIETPEEVSRGVLAFAQRAGIRFGSLDFAVDEKGAWWFLEINEEGQFLWIDATNPEAHIQEKFLAFLTSPEGASRQSIEERQSLFPSWKEYADSTTWELPTPEQAGALPDFVSVETPSTDTRGGSPKP